MKKLALFLLFALAVAYYFGYEPSDLIPSGPTPPPKVRRAPAASPEQTPGTRPQPSIGALVASQPDDGSLANRWKPYPSASPVKP
ncbi:MAG TPA: hypothetical protein VNW72_04640 [Chthoniobacterales bacterium]|nr:hypothetical protein [Chthoniobacterales bacterium]